MSVSILNTTADLSGRTLLTEEGAYTVEGLHTFDRDPNPPFAVSAGSAVVPNLDADKVDGIEGANIAKLDTANTFTQSQNIDTAGTTAIVLKRSGTTESQLAISGGNTFLDMIGSLSFRTFVASTVRAILTATPSFLLGTSTTTNTAAGDARLAGSLWIGDGVTAPTTTAGFAVIYVDTADGDLKVKFGDGTVKTLATDT